MFFYRLDERNTTVESILHFQSAKTDLACRLFLLEILDSTILVVNKFICTSNKPSKYILVSESKQLLLIIRQQIRQIYITRAFPTNYISLSSKSLQVIFYCWQCSFFSSNKLLPPFQIISRFDFFGTLILLNRCTKKVKASYNLERRE